MKTLVVAEKPSVGKDIARVLQCRQKGEGYLYSEQYVVSWAIGHLATLCEPEDYDDAYKRWRLDTLPIIPETMRCKPIPQTRSQLTVLKKLMNSKDIDRLICATDSGREGELIFRYIYQFTGCKKPFRRLWISSMTDAAIQDGFARLKDGAAYDTLYYSAKSRAEADWLVGMNATRAYTVKYGTLLSVGRVQTPTLAILVARQHEINAFVPMDYWEVKAIFQTAASAVYEGLWFDAADEKVETKITDKAKAQAIAAAAKNQEGVIARVTDERKQQPPPQLFDLTALQRECNRVLGYSAQKTLAAAQALYEKHKVITYPRTDSRYISDDMVPGLAKTVAALDYEPYREPVAYLQSLPCLPINARIVDNGKITDHHAIIPTGKVPKGLTPDEQAVFDLIARKFLAAFHPPYIYLTTTVITDVQGARFITKGTTVKDLGWMVLYPGIKIPTPLPPLQEGETVMTTNAAVLAKKTQPPKCYTEATLLSAMENAGRFTEDEALKEQLKDGGLGTPATRAAIIERLIQVGYVERRQKGLVPTEKGMLLIQVVPDALKSPETTGKWERGLSQIAKGAMDQARFMESIKRYVYFIIAEVAKADVTAVSFPKEEKKYVRKARNTKK